MLVFLFLVRLRWQLFKLIFQYINLNINWQFLLLFLYLYLSLKHLLLGLVYILGKCIEFRFAILVQGLLKQLIRFDHSPLSYWSLPNLGTMGLSPLIGQLGVLWHLTLGSGRLDTSLELSYGKFPRLSLPRSLALLPDHFQFLDILTYFQQILFGLVPSSGLRIVIVWLLIQFGWFLL